MYKELVVNSTETETRVALVEDGTIVELFIERNDDSNITGNIYKGRVQRVLPGMQAAFVDIGLNQAAFIHVNDVLGEGLQEIEQFLAIEPETDINGDPPLGNQLFDTTSHYAHQQFRIDDLLTEGQEIMVQVAKSPIGTKGARVTSHISLPGRFLVLMPTVDHIGISKRIEDEDERLRLKESIIALRKENLGYIIRTAAEGIRSEKLQIEMDLLMNTWETIRKKNKSTTAATLLHRDLNVTLRAVRDLLTEEADQIIIDSYNGYNLVKSFLKNFMPSLKISVKYHEGPEPIFDSYNLEGDISRALKKKVWLKSGGYIVIEHTEALVAIDVNTGRYVGKHNFEETILKTNLEALKEIAYQIRLRNLGGIIIIDFIDMEKPSNREKILNALIDALKKDKSKTNVLPMSEMGLIQMTRKRVRKSLNRMLCEPCFYCEGNGFLLSKQSIIHNIYREIMRQSQDILGNKFTVKVDPEIADLLHHEYNHLIVALEQSLNKQVIIYPDSSFHIEQFEIYESLKP